jgi:DNA polymerase III alpha subunit (gram-positive type)
VRRVLIFDVETTGVDPSVDQVIEVAACLYDLEIGCAIESYASLLRADSNPAERINGIPASALVDARHSIEVWRRVLELAEASDVVVAHNAEFDRSFVRAAGIASIADRNWCCTRSDFLWDAGGEGGGRKLVEIVLAYGLGVSSAHRASADVDMMVRLFTRLKERGVDLPEMFKRAARPKKRFVAMVSFEMKHLAKEAGFAWNPERREWWRMMCPDDVEALGFRVAQRDA